MRLVLVLVVVVAVLGRCLSPGINLHDQAKALGKVIAWKV